MAVTSSGSSARTPLEWLDDPSDVGQVILLTAPASRSRVWVRVYRYATHFSEAAC